VLFAVGVDAQGEVRAAPSPAQNPVAGGAVNAKSSAAGLDRLRVTGVGVGLRDIEDSGEEKKETKRCHALPLRGTILAQAANAIKRDRAQSAQSAGESLLERFLESSVESVKAPSSPEEKRDADSASGCSTRGEDNAAQQGIRCGGAPHACPRNRSQYRRLLGR